MTNRKSLNEALTLTSLNTKRVDHPTAVLKNFSVVEDLHITKGACAKKESCSDAMSIFIVTKENGKANLDLEKVDVKKNNSIHLVTSNLNELSLEGQSFLLSGVSFTNDFIKETQIMTESLPYSFNFFSPDSSHVLALEPEDTVTIKHQLRLLAEHARKFTAHRYGKEILVHAFYSFLFQIEALRLRDTDSNYFPFSRQEIHVHKFQNLVQQQFRELRTIKSYAEQLNVSAKYLTEIVKRSTGRHASEMITEQVIKEAKLLLQNPHLSIGEIADKLHFGDQSFFGKYFKRQTAVSPKRYRESVFLTKRTGNFLAKISETS